MGRNRTVARYRLGWLLSPWCEFTRAAASDLYRLTSFTLAGGTFRVLAPTLRMPLRSEFSRRLVRARLYADNSQQLLVDHAREIATMYPQTYRQEYMQAAEQLRAPYWDWAADPTIPSATVPATLQVNFPNGQALQQRHVDNPLGTFIIPQAVLNGQYGTFDSLERPRVLRCQPPQSYPASANNQLASRQYKQWVVSSPCYGRLEATYLP